MPNAFLKWRVKWLWSENALAAAAAAMGVPVRIIFRALSSLPMIKYRYGLAPHIALKGYSDRISVMAMRRERGA